MISLRAYEPKDYDLVLKAENIYFHSMTDEEFKSFYINDPLITIYMIESDKSVVGYVVIWRDLDKSQIYNLLIFSDYRRKGFAFQAIKLLEEKIKQLSVHDFTLEVRVSNKAAIALYEKSGFKTVTVRKDYYQNHEDALLMLKKL